MAQRLGSTGSVQPVPSAPVSGRPLRWLLRPVRRQRCAGPWQFIFRILVQQFALKVIAAILVTVLLPEAGVADRTDLLRSPLLAFVIVVLIAPPLETLLLQAAPIEVLRLLGRSRRVQFLCGSLPFAALHFVGGMASGIAAGIVGGLFFAHTYLECRSGSWWTSLWVTAATHLLHNLVCLLVILPFAI